MEEKWLKLGGAITQMWIVIDPIIQCYCYYCAIGESGPGRLADLIGQDISQHAMHKCRVDGTALTKPVERAVRKKLIECSKGMPLCPPKKNDENIYLWSHRHCA